jgi:hypothetical protein
MLGVQGMPRSEVHGSSSRQTACCLFLTILSGIVAIFRPKNTRVALSFATSFIWLMIVLTADPFQAARNKADLYQVGPFVKPNKTLLKDRYSLSR